MIMALLLLPFVWATLGSTFTVAVFARTPEREVTDPMTVKVPVPPTNRLTVTGSRIFPCGHRFMLICIS